MKFYTNCGLTEVPSTRSLNRSEAPRARAVIVMTIIAAISNSVAETRRDYSNPKPIAVGAKLYADPRRDRRGGGRRAATVIIARRNLIHGSRGTETLKIKDVG